MNKGAQKIRETGSSQVEIAKAIGKTRSYVCTLFNGTAVPSPKMREVFLKIYGIPIASWDLAVGGAEPLPPPTQRVKEPSVAASVPANTALPTNLQLAEMQVRQYLDLAQNPALSPDTRLKVMSSLDGAIQKRAKLQGELDEMTESRMIKTPPFQRIAGVWMDWAHKWPEAARELGLAMQKFDTEGRPPPLEE